jgi:hypothetical protein
MITHELRIGETGSPLSLAFLDGKDPVDMADYTAKVYGETEAAGAWITEGTTGVTEQPTKDFTASASTDRLTSNGHKLEELQQVVLSNSGGALPAGLSASTRYFARNVSLNDFQLSLRPSGAVVNITDAGTGTHSFYVVGVVKYDFQSGDVDTAGNFRLEMRLYDGSNKPRYSETVRVVVKEMEAV